MKRTALFVVSLVFLSQFSLSPAKLVPASWMQSYYEAKDVVGLLFSVLIPGCTKDGDVAKPSLCKLQSGARIDAVASSSGCLRHLAVVRVPWTFSLPPAAEQERIAQRAMAEYRMNAPKLAELRQRVIVLQTYQKRVFQRELERASRAIELATAVPPQLPAVL